MRILTACDHGGYLLKQMLIQHLHHLGGYQVIDLGVHQLQSANYPDYAHRLCQALLAGDGDRGLLLCGTGIGVSITANRYPGIRAALCHDEYTARMSRQHNDANVLVLGGRTTGPSVAEAMVTLWLQTPFEGGRHQQRLDQIDQPLCI